MAELPTRANDSKSISPNRGTPAKPKGAGAFQDLPLAGLFPTAQNPGENVTGAQPAPAQPPAQPATRRFGASSYTSAAGEPPVDSPESAPLTPAPSNPAIAPLTPDQRAQSIVADAGQVALGTPEWEQIQLANAIRQLQEKYTLLARNAGGDLNTDAYWQAELDKEIKTQADSIRQQSANDRAGVTEGSRQSQQAELDRATQREIARNADTASEKASMWSLLGGAALNPTGGAPDKIISIKDGIPVYGGGKEPTSLAQRAGSKFVNMFNKKPEVSAAPSSLGSPANLKDAIAPPVEDPRGQNLVSTPSTSVLGDYSRYVNPSMAGAGIGYALAGKNRGSALEAGLSGLSSSAANYGLDKAFGSKTSAWGNLASGAGMAWANPFSKKAWSSKGRSLGTAAKIVGSNLIGRLF